MFSIYNASKNITVSDHVSVSAWVTEMQEMTHSSILVFKNQGDDDQSNDTNNLAKDDFLLAFQTKYQRDMMTKFIHSRQPYKLGLLIKVSGNPSLPAI